MKKIKEKVESLGLTEAFAQQEKEFEDRLREIIREEIVNYNNVFMSRFGVDEDGVVHLTKKDLN
tara:strand:- start:347 stop:538 length:192 start_codon:yes stop_codon:yes gene_type:complete